MTVDRPMRQFVSRMVGDWRSRSWQRQFDPVVNSLVGTPVGDSPSGLSRRHLAPAIVEPGGRARLSHHEKNGGTCQQVQHLNLVLVLF